MIPYTVGNVEPCMIWERKEIERTNQTRYRYKAKYEQYNSCQDTYSQYRDEKTTYLAASLPFLLVISW